jgi:hypothetical protein
MIFNWISVAVPRRREASALYHDGAGRIVQYLMAAALDDLARRYLAFRTYREVGYDLALPVVPKGFDRIVFIAEQGFRRRGRRSGGGCEN